MTEEAPAEAIKNVKPKDWYPRPFQKLCDQDAPFQTQESQDDKALARLRPQQPTRYQDLIINTLINATNSGKSKNTVQSISYSLKQLNQNADLKNPEHVKAYLANCKVCNATKTKLCFAYNWFCKTNNIQ